MNSQILSNFKLFSKPVVEMDLSYSEKSNVFSLGKYINIGYSIFAVMLIGICGVVYYRQDDIKNVVSSWLAKLWLATHLTSDGELSSTYVPVKFSIFSKKT